uniref:Uncharacterized protein n=1 Tax=Magallana gigas TaxID=29159 RepID=A0A8W8NW63_MAGGI
MPEGWLDFICCNVSINNGEIFKNRCPKNCHEGHCDINTGHCLKCILGLQGPLCDQVCGAINSTMENIMFPNDAYTLRSLKADFFKIAHSPTCVGAIDGTLIPIKGMSGLAEPAFICRKNFCALNIQAVADPNMR